MGGCRGEEGECVWGGQSDVNWEEEEGGESLAAPQIQGSTGLGPLGRIKKYLKDRERRSYEKQYKKKPKAKLGFSLSGVGVPPPPRRDEHGVEMKVTGGGWDRSLINPMQGGEGGRSDKG